MLSAAFNGKSFMLFPSYKSIHVLRKVLHSQIIALSRSLSTGRLKMDWTSGRCDFQAGGCNNPEGFVNSMPKPFPPNFVIEDYKNQIKSGPMRVTCGELRKRHVGCSVELVGRVQKTKFGKFVLLRDGHGATQLVISANRADLLKRFENLPELSYVSIIGDVKQRPLSALNTSMNTGEIEVSITDVVIVKVNRDVNHSRRIPAIGFAREMSTKCNNLSSVTSEEFEKIGKCGMIIDRMNKRVDTCGMLSVADGGRDVVLLGWLQSHKHFNFLVLRDGYGEVQCLLPQSKPELTKTISLASSGTILEVHGVVMCRPSNKVSKDINGAIEVIVSKLNILNPNDYNSDQEKSLNNTPTDLVSNHCDSESGVNSFTSRTHTCGELRYSDVGRQVKVSGWLQHRRMGRFLTLRDSYGVIQCILPAKKEKTIYLDTIPMESVVEVSGKVVARSSETVNPRMPTGEVEVSVEELNVANVATLTPFVVRNFQIPKEQLQLQHRYLYLRYPKMQENLRTRSAMLMTMRKYLIDDHKFVEVETPTLFCRTPGGAKEFVVPTRHKGEFFSLVQSPQQFKQMLMAGAIDRYFQVARCYRDEMTRGDRQPEFTQLDVELSFAGRKEVMSLIEGLMKKSWPHPLPPGNFPQLTYDEALKSYGTDKPDISFDLKIQDVTSQLRNSDNIKSKFSKDSEGCALIVKDFSASVKLKKSLQDFTKIKHSSITLLCLEIKKNDSLQSWLDSSLKNLLGVPAMEALASQMNFEPGDFMVLAYGLKEEPRWCLGDIRLKIAEELGPKLQRKYTDDRPLWVVDFPLFVRGDKGELVTCHHPFTAPHPADEHLLDTEPLKVRSLAYDLVLNGEEIGGGSVRVHSGALQRKLLGMLNLPCEPLSHFLNALDSGCPPHAGIALGVDRLVGIACKTETIRDVIAFPKSHEGRDSLSGAPNTLTEEEQKLYHIKVAM